MSQIPRAPVINPANNPPTCLELRPGQQQLAAKNVIKSRTKLFLPNPMGNVAGTGQL